MRLVDRIDQLSRTGRFLLWAPIGFFGTGAAILFTDGRPSRIIAAIICSGIAVLLGRIMLYGVKR